MDQGDKARACLASIVVPPLIAWFATAKLVYGFDKTDARVVVPYLIKHTFDLWPLWVAPIVGSVLGLSAFIAFIKLSKKQFAGADYKKHYRGTELVSSNKLASVTKENKGRQITVAGIPVPFKAEETHFAICGATGVGKSTIMREMMFCALKRKDRMVILDLDGEFLRTFFKEGDKMLNVYDKRTEGWSFFNEIRQKYDFKRFAKSIIGVSKDANAEEWNNYARQLFIGVAQKLYTTERNVSMRDVYAWTNESDIEDLREFTKGTEAAGIFSGTEKNVDNVRFTLSNKLGAHLDMPNGDFSLREWLEDDKGGNLFITFTEDQREASKSLISAWTDIIFQAMLSLPTDRNRRIWTFADEIESLDYLPSLNDVLTKGRKKGARVVDGFQTYSQLVNVYGEQMAETLLGNHRSVVAMAVGRFGETTAEKVSKALGTMDVERDKRSDSGKFGERRSNSRNDEIKNERAVLPSELMQLPDLEGYVSFPGDLPVAKFKTHHVEYTRRNPVINFIPREDI